MTAQLTAVQLSSRQTPEQNLERVARLLEQLPEQRPQLVVLPEAFSCFGAGDRAQQQMAEQPGEGPVQKRLAELAAQHQVYLIGGTLPLQAGERFAAASLCFGPDGSQLARYDKIHLFDVDVADNTGQYRESRWTRPGNQIVTIDCGFAVVGMAVCYDVRFPELFKALRQAGADIIALPSAFTQVTGAAHWHTLVRSRAIEQQVYMVAPGQFGEHENGRKTYGHSLIVDPWGQVLAEQDHGEACISAEFDKVQLDKIRQQIPVAEQGRFHVSLTQ
ncbi:carbon-nitrogen hydrolase family protein [Idiomarina seosinensis]|uniref:carbon-nitrogen hydrolase family protein n=1 Tax=Idiomarina seosinensis TaxID=281739 RepID=UPI00384DCFB6